MNFSQNERLRGLRLSDHSVEQSKGPELVTGEADRCNKVSTGPLNIQEPGRVGLYM